MSDRSPSSSGGYILIVAEKPAAARKLCDALADPKTMQAYKKGKASYYEIKHDGKSIMIVPAVGHIFGLAEANKKGWTYPVFDTKWVPIPEIDKSKAEFVQDYIDNFKELAASATEFIVATDYDVEGAVIGFTVLKYACGVETAKRMHFSTLTKIDLIEAFENAAPQLDFPQIEAGLTRHELDWLYGINLSRAMTTAIKRAGRWSVISTGRVQGPTLAILAKKELEIKKFKSKPFWVIELKSHKKDQPEEIILAPHETDRFFDKKAADAVMKTTKGKPAIVSQIKRTKTKNNPPTPFSLTKLQTEAYRHFRASPSMTQRIAQSLYDKALISYPRTSSEKLPPQLDLKSILHKLATQRSYAKTAKEILSKKDPKPSEGAKSDPAHPAIHPTGETPKELNVREKKIYDLIVRRFFAVFGESAMRESLSVNIDVNKEIFKASGIRTITPGWMDYYGKYAKFKDEMLPDLEEGEKLVVVSIDMLEKETQPPSRFNQASLIKLLEKENLGTKATRAAIIQTLYDRKYIFDKKIQVTALGLSVIKALETHVPRIVSIELTREFDEKMEKIQEGKATREEVIEKAKKYLKELLEEFKEQEAEIGKELVSGLVTAQEQSSILGECPKCGGTLKKFFNRATRKQFVGCSSYPKCTNSYPLPSMAYIEPMGKVCEECHTPIIKVIRRARRPWTMCLDPTCKTKEAWAAKSKEAHEKKLKEAAEAKAAKEAEKAAKKAEKAAAKEVKAAEKAAAKEAKKAEKGSKTKTVSKTKTKVKSTEIATVDDTEGV